MKLSYKTCLCASLLLVSSAVAETIWANGVNQDGGWYDVNKSYALDEQGNVVDNDGDDMMCYAASAANLIAWWQDSLTAVPTGTPTDEKDIWAKYKSASASHGEKGGDSGFALAWWVSGIYLPTTAAEAKRWVTPNVSTDSSELNAFDGYYYDECNLTSTEVRDFIEAYNGERGWTSAYTLTMSGLVGGSLDSCSLGSILQDGYGVSLSIANDNKTLSHAITLWGVEYNDDGQLTKLWFTDSDDTHYDTQRLVEATVYSSDENPNRIYFSTVTTTEPVENMPGYSYGFGYEIKEAVYIDSVHVLNPNAFSVVPEPATATLSLLALAGLAARRRRQ